jgi:hypothetical protein
MSPHAPHFVWSLPPEGVLRLRPGKAGSAALAGQRGSKAKAIYQQYNNNDQGLPHECD